VHDHVIAVDQHPFAGILAFDADDVAAGFLDFLHHRRCQRTGLSVGGSTGDDDSLEHVR
jgi:hypothetical protein